jgi:VIT1/CCC1 family predicted Fe2+/Mn2+ transporter
VGQVCAAELEQLSGKQLSATKNQTRFGFDGPLREAKASLERQHLRYDGRRELTRTSRWEMIETILFLYVLAVTLAANFARKHIQQSNPSRAAYLGYVFVLLALGAAPLIWLQRTSEQYSAVTVILVGVALIWFAILVSRIYVPHSRP